MNPRKIFSERDALVSDRPPGNAQRQARFDFPDLGRKLPRPRRICSKFLTLRMSRALSALRLNAAGSLSAGEMAVSNRSTDDQSAASLSGRHFWWQSSDSIDGCRHSVANVAVEPSIHFAPNVGELVEQIVPFTFVYLKPIGSAQPL